MERRLPHIAFDAKRIQPYLGGRVVVTSELLSGGACNSNYQVSLSHGEVRVVRFYNRGSVEADRYVMNLVKDTIPVPEILHAGDGWAVMPLLPGAPLTGDDDSVRATGRALARIGRIRFPRPGQLLPGGDIKPYGFGGCEGFIRCWLEKPEVRAWLEPGTIQCLELLIKEEASRLTEIDRESRLVHGDFNPGNILVADGGITGVLDWEFAHSGSPYADLGNLLRHLGAQAAPALETGLRDEGIMLPDDWQRRAALVDLTAQLELLTSTHSAGVKAEAERRIRSLPRA